MGYADRSCNELPEAPDKLSPEALSAALGKIGAGWEAVEGHHLSKTFTFANFVEALAFVNQVGELAEAENHHPDVFLTWGKTRVDLWTHTADGITEKDLILAAKIERRCS